MIKRFIIAFILLVLVAGGLIGFNLFRDKAINDFFANMPVQPATVSTITVEPTNWTPIIQAIGTISANHGVDLTVETTGIVSEIRFEANQDVEQNSVLVQLDDAIQRADLASAQAQADLDRASLQRALELQRRQVGTEVNVDAARAAADASAAQVAKAQAALDQKQLKAPFDGVIGIPQVVVGEYISPGTIVTTLQDLDVMRVDFTVPEQSFGQLKIGQPVRLQASEGETSFTGTISGIDPKIDPVSRLANVRAEVANPEGQLTPGQFVEVRVELPEETDVIALPQTAVVTSLYGDYVFVVRPAKEAEDTAAGNGSSGDEAAEDQSAESQEGDSAQPADGQDSDADQTPSLVVNQVFVKSGRRSDNRVEILEGISAGDRVVSAGQNRLSNGMPVTVVTDDNAAAEGASAEAGK